MPAPVRLDTQHILHIRSEGDIRTVCNITNILDFYFHIIITFIIVFDLIIVIKYFIAKIIIPSIIVMVEDRFITPPNFVSLKMVKT